MNGVAFPMWLNALLFVGGAIVTYLLTQTSIAFDATATVILGVVNVAIIALTAFQRTATAAVRSLRGTPQ